MTNRQRLAAGLVAAGVAGGAGVGLMDANGQPPEDAASQNMQVAQADPRTFGEEFSRDASIPGLTRISVECSTLYHNASATGPIDFVMPKAVEGACFYVSSVLSFRFTLIPASGQWGSDTIQLIGGAPGVAIQTTTADKSIQLIAYSGTKDTPGFFYPFGGEGWTSAP